MLKTGAPAPEFTATDDEGAPVNLASLMAKGPFILFFYPKDFTPVCTKQACMFRDASVDLKAAGVQIYGVSRQDAASHTAFKTEHKLSYPLLVDKDGSMHKAWDTLGPFGLTRRGSYYVDRSGKIADAELADLRVGPHEDFVARVLKKASA